MASKERVRALLELEPGSKIHISGICGTGTAAVAQLLKAQGFLLSGSDKAFYPPMSDIVHRLSDELYEGYSAQNILKSGPDFVVIGNSLSGDNAEVLSVINNKIPYCSMPEAFSARLIGERTHCPNSVVVCGTHGKTTSTSIIVKTLDSASLAPGYFVGGKLVDFSTSIREVSTEVAIEKRTVVVEGDEYDSAFFQKEAKFLSYRPDVLVVTSLEFDHADIYPSLKEIEDEFEKLMRIVPQGGAVFIADSSESLIKLAKNWQKIAAIRGQLFFYGERKDSDIRLEKRTVLSEDKDGAQRLEIATSQGSFSSSVQLSGLHNAYNYTAAAGVCSYLGLDNKEIALGLSSFRGVAKRQQVIGKLNGATLYEDFAHHPTAVSLTIEAFSESHPGKRIVVAFEPRSNTSRRAVFQKDYAKALAKAGLVVIKTPAEKYIYSKYENEIQLLNSSQLVKDIQDTGAEAKLFSSSEEIASYLKKVVNKEDILILVSNGDFDGLASLII